jgi:uncharacterized membrane protein
MVCCLPCFEHIYDITDLASHVVTALVPYLRNLMKSALTFIGFFLLAMGLFWAGQGAGLIRWPAESFMVNARQWIYYGGSTAVIGLVLVLLARR